MPKKPVVFKGIRFGSTEQARCAVMLDTLGYELKHKGGFIYVEHTLGPIVLYSDYANEERAKKIFGKHAYFSTLMMYFDDPKKPLKEVEKLSFYDLCKEKTLNFREVLRQGKRYKFCPNSSNG